MAKYHTFTSTRFSKNTWKNTSRHKGKNFESDSPHLNAYIIYINNNVQHFTKLCDWFVITLYIFTDYFNKLKLLYSIIIIDTNPPILILHLACHLIISGMSSENDTSFWSHIFWKKHIIPNITIVHFPTEHLTCTYNIIFSIMRWTLPNNIIYLHFTTNVKRHLFSTLYHNCSLIAKVLGLG